MAESFLSRLKHAWNAFTNNKDPTPKYQDIGASYPIDKDLLVEMKEQLLHQYIIVLR